MLAASAAGCPTASVHVGRRLSGWRTLHAVAVYMFGLLSGMRVPVAAAAVPLAWAVAVPHVAVQHKQVDQIHRAARQRQEEHDCREERCRLEQGRHELIVDHHEQAPAGMIVPISCSRA